MLICFAYSSKEADGVYEQYFKKQLLTKGQLSNGLKNGEWRFFYPNQNLHFEGGFINDKKQGAWTFFNEKGEAHTHAHFYNDEIDSLKIYFEDGLKVSQEHFNNGAFTGISEYFYPNGTRSAYLKKGKEKTTYRSFHENGTPKFVTVDWFNKKTDTTKVYYSNGQLKERLSFYKSILLAVGETHNENGAPLKNGNFQNGKGSVIRYYDNGQPKSVANYNAGQKHGIAQFYFDNGQIKEAGMFSKGRKIGIWKYYSESGDLLESVEHRGDFLDEEFINEFSPEGLSINKTEIVALFPGGDRALNKLLKEKTSSFENLKGTQGIFLFDLDEFGFISKIDLRNEALNDSTRLEVIKSLTELPRCIPAFEEGLPVASSLTQPFKF